MIYLYFLIDLLQKDKYTINNQRINSIVLFFHKKGLMPVISCLTSLTFWSIFHIISIPFWQKNVFWPQVFKRNNSLCISLVRQIGFPIYFISVAHCCPLVLMQDITLMWQDACHIFKYYIIKCYKMFAIFTYEWQALGHLYKNDTILLRLINKEYRDVCKFEINTGNST